jgi:hypothetical protein
MLTCLRVRHICLTHMYLLQGAPTPASTLCGVPITTLHFQKEFPCSEKKKRQMFSLSRDVAWPPRRLKWICSWYWGGHVC